MVEARRESSKSKLAAHLRSSSTSHLLQSTNPPVISSAAAGANGLNISVNIDASAKHPYFVRTNASLTRLLKRVDQVASASVVNSSSVSMSSGSQTLIIIQPPKGGSRVLTRTPNEINLSQHSLGSEVRLKSEPIDRLDLHHHNPAARSSRFAEAVSPKLLGKTFNKDDRNTGRGGFPNRTIISSQSLPRKIMLGGFSQKQQQQLPSINHKQQQSHSALITSLLLNEPEQQPPMAVQETIYHHHHHHLPSTSTNILTNNFPSIKSKKDPLLLTRSYAGLSRNDSMGYPQLRSKKYFQETTSEDIAEDKAVYDSLLQLTPLPSSRQEINNFLIPSTTEGRKDAEGHILNRKLSSNCFSKSERVIPLPFRKGSNKREATTSLEGHRTAVANELRIDKSMPGMIGDNCYQIEYKKIIKIIDETQHFKGKMKMAEAMLSQSLLLKVLPRKLGVLNNPRLEASLNSMKILAQSTASPSNAAAASATAATDTACSTTKSNKASASRLDFSMFAEQGMKKRIDLSDPDNGIGQEILGGATTTTMMATTATTAANDMKADQELNLSRLQIGSRYAEMLAEGLMHSEMSSVRAISLVDNNLSGTGIEMISRKLPKNIETIDLQENQLSQHDVSAIEAIFDRTNYPRIKDVNLAQNFLTDNSLTFLSTMIIAASDSLRILNLARNKLTDLSAPAIAKIISASSLIELYLPWNHFTSKAAAFHLAPAIETANTLKVLDLSHNSLGQTSSLSSGRKIVEASSQNMLHLDLSYNQFSVQECDDIADYLQYNKTIYGFHIEGNSADAIVDSKGYLYFPSEGQILSHHLATHTLMRKSIQSTNSVGFNKVQNFWCNSTDNCWLCDGWEEVTFTVREDKAVISSSTAAVFLHLDFEDFNPTPMQRDTKDSTRFILRRMCPPRRQIFFFFTNPTAQVLYQSEDFRITNFHITSGNVNASSASPPLKEVDETTESIRPFSSNQRGAGGSCGSSTSTETADNSNSDSLNHHHLQQNKQRKFSVRYGDGTVAEYIVPTRVNVINTSAVVSSTIKRMDDDYAIETLCRPRDEERVSKIQVDVVWNRDKSVFKSFVADTPEIELKCFEGDWKQSKIEQVVSSNFASTYQTAEELSSDVEECKRLILTKFPQIRVLYRYLSSFGLVNEVFCVMLGPFALFAQQSNIVDGILMKMRDLECIFIAASSKKLKVKNARAPEKALTRSEFLEAMGRLAVDKYIRNKVVKTSAEALDMLLKDPQFQAHIAEYEDPQQWRSVRLWTKECDQMLKRYLNFISSLWFEYSNSLLRRVIRVSSDRQMSLSEFQQMVNDFDLKDSSHLTEREAIFSFNLSLTTKVDEINSKTFMLMSFSEFLESIARLAEYKSMSPLHDAAAASKQDNAGNSNETREKVRLEHKIESLLEDMRPRYNSVVKARQRKRILASDTTTLQPQNKIAALITRKNYIQYQEQLSDGSKSEEEEEDNSSQEYDDD